MLPDRVSNPGPLTYESGALPIALRGPARQPCGSGLMFLFRICMNNLVNRVAEEPLRLGS